METFGERLHAAMLAAGIESAAELAKRCGNLSARTVGKYLTLADADLSAMILLRIANTLRCRMRWLAEGNGPVPICPHLDEISAIAERLSPEQLAEWRDIGQRMAEMD